MIPFGVVCRISKSAEPLLPDLTGREATRLGTWLLFQHKLGVDEPMIITNVVQITVDSAPLSFASRIERLHQFLRRATPSIDAALPWISFMA